MTPKKVTDGDLIRFLQTANHKFLEVVEAAQRFGDWYFEQKIPAGSSPGELIDEFQAALRGLNE